MEEVGRRCSESLWLQRLTGRGAAVLLQDIWSVTGAARRDGGFEGGSGRASKVLLW